MFNICGLGDSRTRLIQIKVFCLVPPRHCFFCVISRSVILPCYASFSHSCDRSTFLGLCDNYNLACHSDDPREHCVVCEGAQVVRDDARLLWHATQGRVKRSHRASGQLARPLQAPQQVCGTQGSHKISPVPSVSGSPCRCATCQLSSLQFPQSRALHVAVPHVSPAASSSLCLGLSMSLCPMSAQQHPVPSVLDSPCRCAPCQPSSLQFPLSWALLAAVHQVSPVAFSSSHLYQRNCIQPILLLHLLHV